MLYHMNLASDVQAALIVNSVAQYLDTTLTFLRDTEGAVIPAEAANKRVTLQQARTEVCAKSHVLFGNNDTLKDWNNFLFNAVKLQT
jgi:hypothetical protein